MASYKWLKDEKSPRLFKEAYVFNGLKEIVGKDHNKIILEWAEALGIRNIYTSDEIAWCGLFIAISAHYAGLEINMTSKEALWALNWLKFGTKQTEAAFGDVLVFKRNGGGHVGIYVGEDAKCYHVFGGNQNNQVGVTRIEKNRCVGIRRTDWKVAQPATVTKRILEASGLVSTNEQ